MGCHHENNAQGDGRVHLAQSIHVPCHLPNLSDYLMRGINSQKAIHQVEYPHQLLHTGKVMVMGWNSSRSRQARRLLQLFLSALGYPVHFHLLASTLLSFALIQSPLHLSLCFPAFSFPPSPLHPPDARGKEANQSEGQNGIILMGVVVAINLTCNPPLLTLPPWTFLLCPPLGLAGSNGLTVWEIHLVLHPTQ
jgi:hypothetical protein